MYNCVKILVVLFLFTLNIRAQNPTCPSSEFYLYDGPFIKIYNSANPPSITNPSTLTIPSLGTAGAGLALLPNLNGGTLTPTFYSVSGGTYWYWNGGTWVDTFHSTGNSAALNLAGCNGAIYNLVGATGQVYVYNGTGNGTLLTTLPGFNGGGPYDLVTDCNCNFYALNTSTPNQALTMYGSNGNQLCSYSLNGMPSANGGGGFAIIGNTVYVRNNYINGGFFIGTISGSSVTFTQVSGFSGNASDFASCSVCYSTAPLTNLSISPGGVLNCLNPVVPISILSPSTTTLGLSYAWSGPGISGSSTSSLVTVNTPGTYTCIVSTNVCPPQQATFTSVVTTNSTNVIAVISPSGNVCKSTLGPLQLTVAHSSTTDVIVWSGAGITSNLNSSTATVLNQGTYTVVVTDVYSGCTNSDVVTVAHTPTTNISLSTATICQQSHNGSPNTLLMIPSGASNYSLATTANYSVSTTGTAITCIPKPPFLNVNSVASATLIGTNLFCADTVITSFMIIHNPTIAALPFSGSICPLGNILISVNGASNYSWASVPGLNTYNGSNVVASPTVTSVYPFYGSTQGCNSITKQASVTILPVPNLLISQQSTSTCLGNTITMGVSGIATSYTWFPQSAFANPNLSVAVAAPVQAQVYTVIASLNSCTSSASMSVFVVSPPTLSLSLNSPSVCAHSFQNSPNSITALATGANSYTLLSGSNFSVSNPGGPFMTIVPTGTPPPGNILTTITLLGNTGVCNAALTTSFVVVSNPVISISPPSSNICVGDSQPLSLSGASSYTWLSVVPDLSIVSPTSAIVNPVITSFYPVFGSSQGCYSDVRNAVVLVSPIPSVSIAQAFYTVCAGEQLTLMATGNGLTYNWLPSSSVLLNGGSSAIVKPQVTTIFTVISSFNSCTNSAVTTVSAITLPTISLVAEPPYICSGSSTILKAQGALNYIWLPHPSLNQTQGNFIQASPSKNTIYTVNGFNGLCTGYGTVEVQTIDWPKLELLEATNMVCKGSTVSLVASGAQSYTWLPFEAVLAISNHSFVIANPQSTTNYTLVGANSKGNVSCPQQISYVISVVNPPVLATSGSIALCEGYKTTLKAFGASEYTWQPLKGLSFSKGEAVVANPLVTTTYTIQGSSIENCSSTTTLLVEVNKKPFVFAGRDTSYQINEPIFIQAKSNGHINWISGEGIDCPDCPTTRIYPTYSGCYVVEATNDFNCTSRDQVCLTIARDFNVYLPNSFTPDNNGLNDVFYVYGDNLSEVKLLIFNRWGELIFESNGEQVGWDGRAKNGEPCPAGTYVYQLTYKALSAKLQSKTGSLNLMR
jgi:gliding motility-associated-like protein